MASKNLTCTTSCPALPGELKWHLDNGSKVLWVLMFIHMGFSQAICAANFLPGNAPPCWGVEPVRSSGVWPRKQLGYPDEVLPSQCGLDESCHIFAFFIALKIPLYKTSRPVVWNSKADFKFLYGSWGNSSWAYEAKSLSTLVSQISHLWSALQRNCGVLNSHRICIILRFWLILTSLYTVNVRLWSVCRLKLPQTPLKGDWTVTCKFSLLGSWKSDVNLKWLLCFNIYIFYYLFLQGTKSFCFFPFLGELHRL